LPMSCEPGGGVTSQSRCVMAEKHETDSVAAGTVHPWQFHWIEKKT
jgi:hypothetical protein